MFRAKAKRRHDKSKMALREPCPGRVVDDFGGAFAMGGLGGVIFYFFKGFYNAPSRERFRGAMSAIKFRAPILGGSFGMWGGLFSGIDCSLLALRQEDSPINAVLSGFLTGAILASRSGIQVAWRNGMAGAVILTIIEGVNIGYTNMALKQQSLMMNAMTKIQEERMRRQTAGLPDFTMEEMNQMMMKSVESEPGFFKKMFGGSPQ